MVVGGGERVNGGTLLARMREEQRGEPSRFCSRRRRRTDEDIRTGIGGGGAVEKG